MLDLIRRTNRGQVELSPIGWSTVRGARGPRHEGWM
jgi:hypothetical protein